jgi:hypothetical protein
LGLGRPWLASGSELSPLTTPNVNPKCVRVRGRFNISTFLAPRSRQWPDSMNTLRELFLDGKTFLWKILEM